MASCAYCGSTILFGGIKDENYTFCNKKCHSKGILLKIADQVPEDVLEKYINSVHKGNCPRCNDVGPVDVHKGYRVISFILATSNSTQPQVSCRRCGIKHQLGSTIFTMLLGWWGFPWGIIFTPIYILRNVADMIKGPDPSTPSQDLRRLLRLNLAAQLVEQAKQAKKS